MSKNYRTRIYTKRITTPTKSQINRLRTSRLKKATSYAERKFLNSKSFDATVMRNVRENRVRLNYKTLGEIQSQFRNETQRSVVRDLFGESTRVTKGKVVRVNTLTSYKQTQRLQKISKQISKGQFDIKRYAMKTKRFREIRKHLPTNVSTGDLLNALDRTDFYFENKQVIKQHNANVDKHGTVRAKQLKAGQKLERLYYESIGSEAEELAMKLLNRKK